MSEQKKKSDKLNSVQHYVPQGYLKRFAFDKKRSRLYAYEKEAEPYPTNVRNVGGEKGFYNYVDLDGSKTSELEDVLADIDTKGIEVLRKLDSFQPGYIDLEEEDKQNLLTFISFLHVRNTRDRRENAEFLEEASLLNFQMVASNKEAFHNNAIKALESSEHDYNEKEVEKYRNDLLNNEYKITYDPKEQYFMGQSLAKSKELYKVLYSLKKIALVESAVNRKIVTSDNPVTYFGPEGRPKNMPLGYIHAVFQLPISPNRLLFLVNDGVKLGDFKMTREHVDYHNFFTYRFAERWIFSDIKSKTIKDMFSKHNSKERLLKISSPFSRKVKSKDT